MTYKNKPLKFPHMALVKQTLFSSRIGDIPGALLSSLAVQPFLNKIKPGETVAVAVGSRGISGIDQVLLHCLSFLKGKGLIPFIVPAMGSHGGATAEGQCMVLAKLGITESKMGVPILADMSVECLGQLPSNLKLFFSKKALEADHIVIINRVKPHTKFRADIESGLCKMLTIGLGKSAGAVEFHRRAVQQTFKIIEDAGRAILKQAKILFGIALLEDGYGELTHIEAVLPASFIDRDKALLREAAENMGRIPLDFLDILVIDIIGKDISGIGMDSNVTGRHRDIVGDFNVAPHVKRIFVRDLSPDSDGNGNGIGLADFTTKRLVDALDMEKTYINAATAISPEKAAIPMHFDTDRKALEVCAATIGLDSMAKARMVRIKDTGRLELLQVSEALKREILSNPNLKPITPWRPMQFDDHGNLMEFSAES